MKVHPEIYRVIKYQAEMEPMIGFNEAHLYELAISAVKNYRDAVKRRKQFYETRKPYEDFLKQIEPEQQ